MSMAEQHYWLVCAICGKVIQQGKTPPETAVSVCESCKKRPLPASPKHDVVQQALTQVQGVTELKPVEKTHGGRESKRGQPTRKNPGKKVKRLFAITATASTSTKRSMADTLNRELDADQRR